MDPVTIIALLETAIKLGAEIPALVALIEQAIGLVKSGTAPTVEQQALIDGALDAAHKRLQGLAAPAAPAA